MMPTAEKFHSHLDVCQQCRTQPFDLCQIGYKLLIQCSAEAQSVPGLRQCRTCGRPEQHCTCLEGAEQPPASRNMDSQEDSSIRIDSQEMDQRPSRSRKEVEHAVASLKQLLNVLPACGRGHELTVGAWLALDWVLDPSERMTLAEHIKIATGE